MPSATERYILRRPMGASALAFSALLEVASTFKFAFYCRYPHIHACCFDNTLSSTHQNHVASPDTSHEPDPCASESAFFGFWAVCTEDAADQPTAADFRAHHMQTRFFTQWSLAQQDTAARRYAAMSSPAAIGRISVGVPFALLQPSGRRSSGFVPTLTVRSSPRYGVEVRRPCPVFSPTLDPTPNHKPRWAVGVSSSRDRSGRACNVVAGGRSAVVRARRFEKVSGR